MHGVYEYMPMYTSLFDVCIFIYMCVFLCVHAFYVFFCFLFSLLVVGILCLFDMVVFTFS